MMTEQIIIDGCNVAECHNLIISDFKKPICKNGGLRGGNRSHLCEDNNNCYFRQLQRLKAENEKFKNQLDLAYFSIQQAEEELKIIKKQKRELLATVSDYKEDIKELRQENDELKEEYTTLLSTYNACEKEYKALCKRYHTLQKAYNSIGERI